MNGKLGLGNIVGILYETFKIYKKNFNRLLTIVVIVQVPWYLLRYILTPQVIVIGGKIESLSPVILIGTIFMVDSIVARPLIGGALIHAVSEQTLGRKISINRAYRFVGQKLQALIGATLLVGLAIMGMSILFPLAVYYGVRWTFIWQAVLLRGLGARAALTHSSYLVEGNWWQVFAITLALGILWAAIWGILGIIPVVGRTAGIILSTPIITIGRTLLYYNLRAIKEQYGLKSLAGELDSR